MPIFDCTFTSFNLTIEFLKFSPVRWPDNFGGKIFFTWLMERNKHSKETNNRFETSSRIQMKSFFNQSEKSFFSDSHTKFPFKNNSFPQPQKNLVQKILLLQNTKILAANINRNLSCLAKRSSPPTFPVSLDYPRLDWIAFQFKFNLKRIITGN